MSHLYSPQPLKVRPALSFRWVVKCETCYGAGWFVGADGYCEMYCRCEAGKWRRVYDGGSIDEHWQETDATETDTVEG